MEYFGYIVKLLSPVLTAAFGILALGTEPRGKDGRLTHAGQIALEQDVLVTSLLRCKSDKSTISPKRKNQSRSGSRASKNKKTNREKRYFC